MAQTPAGTLSVKIQGLGDAPIRTQMTGPRTTPDEKGRMLDGDDRTRRIIAAFNDRNGERADDAVDLATGMDEVNLTLLVTKAELQAFSPQGGTQGRLKFRHAIIRAALERAQADGEIWNPFLEILTEEITTMGHRGGTIVGDLAPWSKESTDAMGRSISSIQFEPLPSPSQWLAGARTWIEGQDARDILARLGATGRVAWAESLAKFGAPMSRELVKAVAGAENPDLVRTLARRPWNEADSSLMLESLIPGDDLSDLEYISAWGPGVAATATHEVAKRIGRISEPFRSTLEEAARRADTHSGKPVASLAQVLRALDPTTEAGDLLEAATHAPDDLAAAFAAHEGVASIGMERLVKRIRHTSPYVNAHATISCFLKEEVLSPAAMENLARMSLAKDKHGKRTGKSAEKVIGHQCATQEAARVIFDNGGMELPSVKLALAKSAVALQDEEIVTALSRTREDPKVLAALIVGGVKNYLDLWDKLLASSINEALRIIEDDLLPEGVAIPRETLAPIMAMGEDELGTGAKEMRERAMGAMLKLKGGVIEPKRLRKVLGNMGQ